MTSADSYRMRSPEDLTEHVADITVDIQNTEDRLKSLKAQRDMVLGVITELTVSLLVDQEAALEDTPATAERHLSIVAAVAA
ncbi:MAG TPA: hypothetical protein VIH90_05655 [Candidatus Saccharimonadales bacterium]